MERKRSVRRHRRYEKSFFKKCKEYCRTFIAFLFSNVGIIGLVVGYTIAGAFIFRTIESQHHLQIRFDVVNNRKTTARLLWNKTLGLNPFNETQYKRMLQKELIKFQKRVVYFVLKGYDGNRLEYDAQWSFAGAFLYSLTVITTIGYGHIVPHTMEGKITTIVYAIIGMPLFLLYLSNIGDVMARSFKWIYANLCLCRWCPGVAKRRAERQKHRARLASMTYEDEVEEETQFGQQEGRGDYHTYNFTDKRLSIIPSEMSEATTSNASDEEEYDVQAVTVPITICLMIMVGYICGGAILFCKWEDWEFLDASYFCFISLSTIGFGDLVPGEKIVGHVKNEINEVFELSFIFCAMYLMIGMALIAMCFNLMQEEVIHKIKNTIRTIKYIFRCNR